MKRILVLLLVITTIPFLLGMGSFDGNTVSGNIPVPEKKFKAIFVDQSDVLTECSEISIEGKTFVEGKMGEGTYTVPFENIESILFFLKDGKLTLEITLKEKKEKISLYLKKDFKAYGRTQYGTYQIGLENLKKMIIKGATS